MNIILQLVDESDIVEFSDKIKKNLVIFHDLLRAPKSDIVSLKERITELVLFRKKLISDLNYNVKENSIFLQTLLYLSIKLNLKSSLKVLFEISKRKNLNLPLRLKVALLYLSPYPFVSDIVDNFDAIVKLINENKEEEDDSKELTAMIVQYFAYLLYNYAGSNASEVVRLQDKIKEAKINGCYIFLNTPIIDRILQCNISDHVNEYNLLLKDLDIYLFRRSITFNQNDYLIEESGNYYDIFASDASYENLLSIARSTNPNVYDELGRGVAILNSEDQMLQYLYSFGCMHEAKLKSAFEPIDFDVFEEKHIELVDWGCGQGIASVLFKEYADRKYCNPIIDKVTLIEPSEMCIKRAALHVDKIVKPKKIITLNSTLDDLSYGRLQTSNENIKIHLFSNILDVESFSLKNLIKEIYSNFGGINYFICVSPYINDLKTNRLDVFMQSFANKQFNLLKNENISNVGYWSCSKNHHGRKCVNHPVDGCSNKWRKALRVFSVDL